MIRIVLAALGGLATFGAAPALAESRPALVAIGELPLPAPQVGDTVLALESVTCAGDAGGRARIAFGSVTGMRDGERTIGVDRRLVVAYARDARGISRSEWQCVPRRKFCVGPADTVPDAPSEITVGPDAVVAYDTGTIVLAKMGLDRQCGF